MKRSVILGDITGHPADALIYSTNVRLALTGGVGAGILARYGVKVQIDLHNASSGFGRQLAEVGDVLQTTIAGAPWKVIFHTIATDELYRTEEDTVRHLLKVCLRDCAARSDIKVVACSALGSGYGDLNPERFVSIVEDVTGSFESSSIECFTIVESDLTQFAALRNAARMLKGWDAEAEPGATDNPDDAQRSREDH